MVTGQKKFSWLSGGYPYAAHCSRPQQINPKTVKRWTVLKLMCWKQEQWAAQEHPNILPPSDRCHYNWKMNDIHLTHQWFECCDWWMDMDTSTVSCRLVEQCPLLVWTVNCCQDFPHSLKYEQEQSCSAQAVVTVIAVRCPWLNKRVLLNNHHDWKLQ